MPQYGGIGGKGGDVYITGTRLRDKLESVLSSKECKAGWYKGFDGHNALRTRLVGESGKDMHVKVPLGVTVTDADGQLVGDINEHGQKVIAALGGRGGDKFNDNHGFQGQKRTLNLDYKMISDTVFVGFPNAGKSSLLGAISKTRPKVASYPFTTLRPYLGYVEYQDYRQITMADLPGLVEGAHKNLGLGHDFLKHIVRSRVLTFVIDINNVDLGPNYQLHSPVEALCILNKEIELYDDTLLKKPAILVVSKVDSFTKGDYMKRYEKFREQLELLQDSKLDDIKESIMPEKLIKFDEILPVSSTNKLGLNKLKYATRLVIDKYEEMAKLERDKISSYEDLQPTEFNRLVQR